MGKRDKQTGRQKIFSVPHLDQLLFLMAPEMPPCLLHLWYLPPFKDIQQMSVDSIDTKMYKLLVKKKKNNTASL